MPETPEQRSSWVRFSALGVELAAAIAGFTLVGYWVDLHWGSAPWGLVVGVLLGVVGGMYNLIRQSLAASREAAGEETRNQGEEER
ncbi:MAG: AtpZ/AtpI family protein [Thermoanaerobaculia bacterium]